MSLFVSEAWAEGASGLLSGPGDPLMGMLFPIVLVAVLYFVMIRPQVKRQKEHKQMVEALGKGDEVVTIGGMAGRITDLGENFAKLEVSPGVEVKIRRQAVETLLPKGSLKEL
ncbi:Sec translocon accessory complex subunit YajC [Gammaproteobacteria bacterium]